MDLLDCRRFAPGVTLHELFRLIARYAVNDIALQSGGSKKRVDLGIGIRFVPLPRGGQFCEFFILVFSRFSRTASVRSSAYRRITDLRSLLAPQAHAR